MKILRDAKKKNIDSLFEVYINSHMQSGRKDRAQKIGVNLICVFCLYSMILFL